VLGVQAGITTLSQCETCKVILYEFIIATKTFANYARLQTTFDTVYMNTVLPCLIDKAQFYRNTFNPVLMREQNMFRRWMFFLFVIIILVVLRNKALLVKSARFLVSTVRVVRNISECFDIPMTSLCWLSVKYFIYFKYCKNFHQCIMFVPLRSLEKAFRFPLCQVK